MAAKATQARVLVIDDDDVALTAIGELLEAAGFRVTAQQSPLGAVQVIVRDRIDVVVIDLNMPEMQGDAAVRLLQAWDRVKDVPVVVISGARSQAIDLLQADLPSTRFVAKASLRTDLVSVVEHLLQEWPIERQTIPARQRRGEHSDVLGRFQARMLSDVRLASLRWRGVCEGSQAHKAALLASLATLRGQAQLLGLEHVTHLLSALCVAVEAAALRKTVGLLLHDAVEDAIGALLSVEHSSESEPLRAESTRQRMMAAAHALNAAINDPY